MLPRLSVVMTSEILPSRNKSRKDFQRNFWEHIRSFSCSTAAGHRGQQAPVRHMRPEQLAYVPEQLAYVPVQLRQAT